MFATRSVRSRRPALWSAGRLLANALVVLAMIMSVVFAHGGGCAAVMLSEAGAHAEHTARFTPITSVSSLDARCLHRELPLGHHHGTEQDCSAINPAGVSVSFDLPAGICASSAPVAGRFPAASGDLSPPAVPGFAEFCALRI
ncbi:hypothetical protein [Nonomuraea sp. NEAU-A123]|uniref:hypothetical protein n=1 Tax=Nonomuraea sp. NEAU-A123 TaxID=2839649 RepID=UPI001BE4385E|nr:hypothetical protein [Nonomuraea sp. NEAU-A123]MBT2227704.1 hypothetical protein [Nonomuraea sp. NEAU-A123]